MYYRGAACALVVYDITSSESFNGAKTWIDELQRQGSNDIIIALAGNKCDLDDKRDVSTSTAQSYAQQNNLIFYETSARTGVNIKQLFIDIAKKLPKQQKQRNTQQDINLINQQNTSLTNKCCS